MNKKIKKYVKKLVAILLIANLTMLTFAEVRVDSDAFITKEEFDKIFNDFDSHLSAFESGINAKIDSQVTSYLHRNSIWTKIQQDFYTDYIDSNGNKTNVLFDLLNTNSQATWDSAAGLINNVGFLGKLSQNCYWGWRQFPSKKYAWASKKIVDKISKNGLCVAVLEFSHNVDLVIDAAQIGYTCSYLQLRGTGTYEKWFQINHMLTQEYRETTPIPIGNADTDIDATKCYDDLPNDVFGNQIMVYPEFESSDANTKYKQITVPCGSYTFMGFVKKGQPLYYAMSMIGANEATYGLAGLDAKHIRSWHITNADIGVY